MKKEIKNIYKYLKLKNLISTLENGIFMANPVILNDPFEYDGIKHIDKFKIGYLTSSFKNKLMWSIYGDSHKGCLLQFKFFNQSEVEEKDILRRVNYTNKVIKNRNKLKTDDSYNYLFNKDKKWQHELEIRLIYRDDYFKKNKAYRSYWERDNNNNCFFKCDFIRVYLGAKAELSDDYLGALVKLRKIVKKENIKISKMILSESSYRIIVNNNFNIDNEIERIIKK